MAPAQDIARLGFKRWYERQLIEGHGYLVTCFLCMILVAASLEELNFRDQVWRVSVMLGLALGGGLLGLLSWARYKAIMTRAERLGDQSICRTCGAYAKFSITASGAQVRDGAGELEDADPWLRVRCRKCGHEWRID